MWTDNETDRDFLNFEGIADTIAELVEGAAGRPVSIGVSGAWGAGKSSMIKLTKASLEKRQPPGGPTKYVYVEFNAWLYQGYDDARAALLEVIATRLQEEAESRKTGVDKAKEFMGRVRWLRVAKLVGVPAVAAALGLPPVGLLGDVSGLINGGLTGTLKGADLEQASAAISQAADSGKDLLKPKEAWSPPKEIQALRDAFESTLEEVGVTLVVLIDDLDRCMPGTTISTLEAIRLFLFLRNTAFVIAADDTMIKHAVRMHFGGLESDELVTNYFDKLVQIPIRVPALGTQEVRAYLMLLFIENSDLDEAQRNILRDAIARQLRVTWKGQRVDRAFVGNQGVELNPALVSRLETAERLAPLMTTADRIAGNPRLIKRFLNALAIRMAISHAQGIGVDEAVLAKLLLFERLASPGAFAALAAAVNADPDGKPVLLRAWEEAAAGGDAYQLEDPWNLPFIHDWLTLPPALGDQDLRGALYVGREQAPLITASDRLTSEAAEILAAVLDSPEEARAMSGRLRGLSALEISIIGDRVLAVARQEQEWGTPPILEACLTLAEVDYNMARTLAGFLIERPGQQIRAGIVPRIREYEWAADVFRQWDASSDVDGPTKKAIGRK